MDKRSEPRIEFNIRFFVHVHECPDDLDLVGLSVACDAVDVSTRGLQFKTEINLAAGSLLNITIGIGEPFAMYLLRGEIRWSKEKDGKHYAGVVLLDEEGTDLKKWESDFSKTFHR